MSSAVEDVDTATVLTQIDTLIDQLLAAPQAAATDQALLDDWVRTDRITRRLGAYENNVVAEVDTRGLAHERSVKSTAALGCELLQISGPEATRRVRAARNLGPRRTLAGEPIQPIFPQVATALRAGELSREHAKVITHCVERLPEAIRDDVWDEVETTLVGYAHTFDPRLLGKLAQRIGDYYDPDGKLHDAAYRDRTREFRLHRNTDGSSTVSGSLTAELTEYLLTIQDALAGPNPAGDGTKDQRTAAQRNHDALLEAVKIAIGTGLVPKAGGLTATIILTFDNEAWTTGEGFAKTAHGALVPASEAIRWAGGNPRAIGVVLNSMKAITAYSNTHRIFTEQQRLAMLARDGGFCTAPRCDAPPGHAEAHHVTDFAETGRTSVDDGAWACCVDHRDRIAQGWRTIMLDGRPHWVPPKWLDPTQTPQRNHWNDI